ncbi:50S ribosomal protein L25 [Entomospira culicis]|uniref:Large ribosomal subunit protein bL25 n=1 Tax=Entomospira culicis TaxID=2719989 RepID=A0A968GI58_9SPIO|nr:50S ribosomal protein L25 [Entomospira culicis]NIZ18860.1 50S ribosomal protein L25 [Entomospira culicis]NIZ69075.1 50S ribosomal protein L25 [Entomospira culicis]WDI37662.1 50S ribosomal protein L25 [Entomospira culicis]WDI39290.1 50S ribosomal protein L25 [Entomospira culicis]
MSKNLLINAKVRNDFGKNANGRLRKSGLTPVVLYGEGREGNLPLVVDSKEFAQTFKYINLNSTIVKLAIEGQGEVEILVKEYQFDPVRDVILHVDFYQMVRDALVKTNVPLLLTGSAIGLREGGVVSQKLSTIEVESMKRFAPAKVLLDISALKIGEQFTVADIKTLENVRFVNASETVVVTVDAPQ